MRSLTVKNFFRVFKCPVCREPIRLGDEGEGVFCSVCRAKWEIDKRKLCSKCGLSADLCCCMPELIKKSGARALIKLCFYDADSGSPADRLILYLKDYRDKRVSDLPVRELSMLLHKYFEQNGIEPSAVTFTYAPRSISALEKKGFDQAKILSLGCARLLGASFSDIVKRKRFSRSQKGLDSAGRVKNAKGAFAIKRNARLDGKTVVLIDDVVTTGASLLAVSELLKGAGAGQLICASIALTETK